MNEAAIRKKLTELSDAMTGLPQPGAAKPAAPDGLYCSHISTREQSVEDSLDYLRMQVKYLVFDLEATRRENRYLRQMLDNRNRHKGDAHGGTDDF